VASKAALAITPISKNPSPTKERVAIPDKAIPVAVLPKVLKARFPVLVDNLLN